MSAYLRNATRMMMMPRQATPFDPSMLFVSGEVGVWYDPSDLSTLFQDAAGTTPVTDVEQPVGLMLDKSGNGFDATQSTAAARPVLRQDGSGSYYLAFDGIDDYMIISGLTTGATPITAHFGHVSANGESDTFQYLVSLNSSPANGFLAASANIAGRIGYYNGSWTNADINTEQLTVATFDLNSTRGIVRSNGTEVINAPGAWPEIAINGTVSIGNLVTGGAAFNGSLYQIVLRAASSSSAEIQRAEIFVAGKTGVIL